MLTECVHCAITPYLFPVQSTTDYSLIRKKKYESRMETRLKGFLISAQYQFKIWNV